MNKYKIAVVAGDGIGPEVVASGVEVMRTVARLDGAFDVELLDAPAGATTFLHCGDDLPESTLATCRAADAIFLGACGLPQVRRPDGTELTPQITLRRVLDLYAGIRPARSVAGIPSPLAGEPAIDLAIVRESTEGLFASLGGGSMVSDDVAADTQIITRKGTERVVRAAFELARRRARPEPRVTCVDKANVLRSFAFFRKVFDEVAARYSDVAADHLYVDAAALELVRRPERFDVLVTENLLGDILSDLAAGLVGGMGVAPSADLGDHHAVFQPCHGTAPDLAGQGVANPVAAILSAAMMLEHLAFTRNDDSLARAARRIEAAVAAAVGPDQTRTVDVGGHSSTAEVTAAVLARLHATSR
jgi:3-isopropylmalate dehydrogenase